MNEVAEHDGGTMRCMDMDTMVRGPRKRREGEKEGVFCEVTQYAGSQSQEDLWLRDDVHMISHRRRKEKPIRWRRVLEVNRMQVRRRTRIMAAIRRLALAFSFLRMRAISFFALLHAYWKAQGWN